jgi:hypothetical protein
MGLLEVRVLTGQAFGRVMFIDAEVAKNERVMAGQEQNFLRDDGK